MSIPLIDESTGQLYDAPDEAGAEAQIRAFGLTRAAPDQVDAYDLQRRQGGTVAQLKTIGQTALATADQTVAGLAQTVVGGEVIERHGDAYGAEAQERRAANPRAAMIGAALPDLALQALIPGSGLAGIGARAVVGGAAAAAGEAVVTGEEFSAANMALYGVTGGVLEGVSHLALGQAMRAVGKARSVIDDVVGRVKQAALTDAAAEVDPLLRSQALREHATEFYDLHQTKLDEAIGTIGERLERAPERMFSPSALKKSVSANHTAQSDHFLELAVQLRQASDVTGDATLEAATQLLQDGLEGTGPKMYGALRQARRTLSEALPDSPLAHEALQALDDSLHNQSLWGRAAKHHGEFAGAAVDAAPPGFRLDPSHLDDDHAQIVARDALDAWLGKARQQASLGGDKKLQAAIAQAEKAIAGADEVTGARVMSSHAVAAADRAAGLADEPGKKWRGNTIDRLRREAGYQPPAEPKLGALDVIGKAKKFGNDLAEYELDNFVQTGLKSIGATVGHTVGGIPGGVAGYLVGRWLHIRFGDQITRFVWKSAKNALLNQAKKAPLKTAATVAGGALGGALAGVPGAVGAAAAVRAGIASAAEKAEQIATATQKLGDKWSRRIWKQERTAAAARGAEASAARPAGVRVNERPYVYQGNAPEAHANATPEAFDASKAGYQRRIDEAVARAKAAEGKGGPPDEGGGGVAGAAGTALLVGASALTGEGKDETGRTTEGDAPLAASAGLIGILAFFLPAGGRRQLTQELGEALHGLSARERMSLRMATERAAVANEALLRGRASGAITGTPEELVERQYENIALAYQHAHGLPAESAWDHASEGLKAAMAADTAARNAAIIEHDEALLALAQARGEPPALYTRQGGGEAVQGSPELRRMGLPEPGETAVREMGAGDRPLAIEGEAPTSAGLHASRVQGRWEAAEHAYQEGDMPERAARDWSRRMSLIQGSTAEQLSRATADDLTNAARGMLHGWESDFRSAIGSPPNARASEYAEASFHGAMVRRQQELARVETGLAGRPSPSASPLGQLIEGHRNQMQTNTGYREAVARARGATSEVEATRAQRASMPASAAERDARAAAHGAEETTAQQRERRAATARDIEHSNPDFALTSPNPSEAEPAIVHGIERGLATRLDTELETDLLALEHHLDGSAAPYEDVTAKQRWPGIRDRARAFGRENPSVGEDAAEAFAKTRFDEQVAALKFDPDELMDTAAKSLAEGGYDLDSDGLIATIGESGQELNPALERAIEARFAVRESELQTIYERANIDVDELVERASRAAHWTGRSNETFSMDQIYREMREETGERVSDVEREILEERYRNTQDFETAHEEGQAARRAEFDDSEVREASENAAEMLGNEGESLNIRDLRERTETELGRSLDEDEFEFLSNRYQNTNEYEEFHTQGSGEPRERHSSSDDDDEPIASRRSDYNRSGIRDPNVDDGLPKQWALERAGLDSVNMGDHGGIKNVFGDEPLTMADVTQMFALNEIKDYASSVGKEIKTSLLVTNETVSFTAQGSFGVDMSMDYTRTSGGIHVYAGRMFFPKDIQGQGLSKKIIRSAFPAFERRGATQVKCQAAEIGRYAWLALGFRPDIHAEEYAKDAFSRWLHLGVSSDAIAATVARINHSRDLADATVPLEQAEGLLRKLREIGGAKAEALFIKDGQIKAGKAFLLSQSGPWNNGLKLTIDRQDPWYLEFLNRVGLLGAAGLTTEELLRAFSQDTLEFGDGDDDDDTPVLGDQALLQQHADDQAHEQQKTETTQKLAYVQQRSQAAITTTARALVTPSQKARTVAVTAGITQSAGVALFAANNDNLRSAYEQKKATLQRLQTDPMALVEEMTHSLADVGDAAPALHGKLVAQTYKVVGFLQGKLPGTIGASLMRPDGVPPSDTALRQFALYYSAATNPSSVLTDLGNNRARKEQIETLRELWPETYQGLKMSVLEHLSEETSRPTLAQRTRLDLLFDFGESLDKSLSSRIVQARIAYLAEQPEKPQGGAAPTRRTNPSIRGSDPLARLSVGDSGPGPKAA